jgi:lipoprotein-releasing system ATP-binding protein
VGFVFQFYHLLGDFSALENVMLPATLAGGRKKDAKKKAEALLDEVGLGARLTHHPSELSGGEQQRVAIARSLVNDPEVLFCDEPTGNLDSQTGGAVCDYLKRLCAERHKTILIVTHDDKIAQMAGRVMRLKDGKWE